MNLKTRVPPSKTFQWVVVLALLSLFLFVMVFTNRTLRTLEQNLPSILLEQLQMLTVLVEAVADFSVMIEQTLPNPNSQLVATLNEKAEQIHEMVIQLRESFVYDNLVQASALHSIVAPAIVDARIWLKEGLSGYSPHHPITIKILQTRIQPILQQGRALNRESYQAAQGILEQQRRRIDTFLVQTNILFGINLAACLGLLLLLFRQHRAEKREAHAQWLRVQAEEALSRRNAFEHLLMGISRGLIDLSDCDFDRIFSQALEDVGKFLEADCTVLILLQKQDSVSRNGYIWNVDPSDPIQIKEIMPLIQCAKFMERMRDGQHLLCASAEKMIETEGKDWSHESEFFQQRKIQSLIYLPIEYHHTLFGVMGFEATRSRREWNLDDVYLLRILSDLFASAFQRRIIEQRLVFEAMHDFLTGIPNRKSTLEALERELARSQRNKSSLAVGMIDLDHFKIINDTYGHQAGDTTLILFTEKVRSLLRSYDTFGRVGGEEFLVLVPLDREDQDPCLLFKRICEQIAQSTFQIDSHTISITISIGVSTAIHQSEGKKVLSTDQILSQADKALYRAKETGRNRVVLYSSLLS